MRNLSSFITSLKFEPLVFENAARYLNADTKFFCRNDRVLAMFGKVGPSTHPREALGRNALLE